MSIILGGIGVSEAGESKFYRVLSRLGFQSKRDRAGVIWTAGKTRASTHISIAETSDALKLQTLDISWNIDAILKSLQTELMSLWGRNLRVSHQVTAPQSIAIMVEWSEKPSPTKKPNSRQNPPTAIGWTFRIDSEDQMLKLFFEDLLVLGVTAPEDWPADLIQATAKAVLGRAYRHLVCRSIHEFECSMLYVVMNQLETKLNPDDLMQLDELLKQDGLTFTQGSWRHLQSAWAYTFKRSSDIGDQQHSNNELTFEQSYQGIEILEARASGDSIRAVDFEIVNRRSDIPQIKGKNTIALKRRLMRFLQNNHRDLSPHDIETCIQEPAFASARGLAASALLRMHYQDKQFEKALNALKLWTDVARLSQGKLEAIETLNIVLPEFAGIFLASVAPEQALHALERAQSDGDEPRILARMVEITKSMHSPDQELELLERWRRIERRQDQLEHIIGRQVELQIQFGDLTTAAKNLEYLVVKHTEQMPQWLTYVDLLADHGEPQRSLVILDRIERYLNQKPTATIKEKIALNASIARVWDTHLGRVDLALPRYMFILELDGGGNEVLVAAAENAMERAGDQNGSLISKMRRWQDMSNSTKTKAQNFAWQIIAHAREFGEIKSEFSVSLDLLEMQCEIKDLTARIDVWLNHDLPWRAFMSAVLQFFMFPQHKIPQELSRLLSRVARVKLEDHDLAIQLLLQNNQAAKLDETEFTYIIDHLNAQGRSLELEPIVIERLDAASPDARLMALKYLIKYSVKDDSGKINRALLDDWMDRREADLIIARWTSLIEDSQIAQASALLKLIEHDLLPTITIKTLVESMIETTLAFPPEQTDTLLLVLIRLNVEINEHDTETVQRAAHLAASSSDPQSAAPYIKVLLQRKVNIDLPDTLVHRALKGDDDLLVQFNLQRIGGGHDSDKTSYARNAVELIKRGGLVDAYTTPVIEQLIKSAAVRPDDLVIIRKFAAVLHRPRLLIDSLKICSDQSDDQTTKRSYADDAAEIAQKSLKDFELAYDLLKDVIDTSAPSLDALHLANLALKAGHSDRSRQIALELLRNPDCIHNPTLVLESYDMLVALKEDRTLLVGIMQTLMSWADHNDQKDLKDELTDISIFKGLCTPQELSSALVARLSAGNIHKSAAYMTKIFERAEAASESLSDVVTSTKAVLTQLGFDNYWWQLIGEMLHGPDAPHTTPALRKELLCQYGLFLYEQDGRQVEALKTLLMLSRENPKDKRVWIPVYILLEETQDAESQIIHLENIIPHIEIEPSVLSDYPLHVETLKAALKRARERVTEKRKSGKILFSESSHHSKNAKSSLNQFRPPSSAAEVGGAAAKLSELQQPQFQETDPGRVAPIYFVAGAAAQFELPKDETENAAIYAVEAPQESKPEPVEPEIDVQPAYQYQSDLEGSHADESVQESDNASKVLDIDNPNLRFSTEADRVVVATLNWRGMATSLEAPRHAAETLARTAFASEAEKHLAIQVAAILCADIGSLDNWHWRVWRESAEFGYPLTSKERIPKFNDLLQLGTPVHRFLSAFAPAIARNHRDRFTIEDRIRSKNPLSNLAMRELKLSDPAIQRTGLRHHSARFEQARLTFVDTPDLGSEIFLDATSRSIHFSADICMAKPPGYLLHRTMALVWAMQMQYHVILRTDAAKQIDPLYQMFLGYSRATPLERIRLAFSTENGKIQKLTQGLNREKLNALAQQAGSFGAQDIRSLQSDMTRHIYRVILAESLDLIGIFEALTGDIITTLSRDEIQDRLRKSVVLRDLFAFATKLFL